MSTVKSKNVNLKECLIICNGRIYKKDLKLTGMYLKPRRAIKIIACDGASDFLKTAGITPDVIIGDMDSAKPSTLNYFSKKKVLIRQIKDQNKNDLEKAFLYAISKNIQIVHLIGLTGKRLDHTLNNISILIKFHNKIKFIVYEDGFTGHIVTKHYSSVCKPGTIVSLIPLPEANGVNTTGMKYPLRNEKLALGKREGALNVTTGNSFSVTLRKGMLLVLVK